MKTKADTAPAPVAQPKELRWVNLRDSNGRASSLCLNCRGLHPGHFAITGNLEHGATIRCDTHGDAVKLADHVTCGSYSELLAACKELLEYSGDSVPDTTQAEARAAIRKAQGGQP